MPHSTIYYGLLAALAIALLFAACTDLKRREIDNWLNAAIALAAPVGWWAAGLAPWPDIALHLGVALLAFSLSAALFALGQMGGGDVKLIAALALWFPPSAFLQLMIIMAMLGYALTLGLGAWRVRQATGSIADRDSLVVIALSLVALVLIAIFAGWIPLTIPAALRSAASTSLAVSLVLLQLPVIVLAAVSFQAIRIFRRRQVPMAAPYGVAIAGAGLWLIAGQLGIAGSLAGMLA